MNKMKKTLAVLSLLIIVASLTASASPRTSYGSPAAQYKAAEGFEIISYSGNWNTNAKLKEIKNELLSNTTSKELKALKAIYIYPDSPEGVLGYTHIDISRDSKAEYVYGDNTYIEIFDGDNYKEVDELARVLSHEYGHHFTAYYLVQGEGRFFDTWEKSSYAKYRDPIEYPKITYQNEYENDLYRWDIQEIAAEDYVQLFGSPKAKQSVKYLDISQKINKGVKDNFNYTYAFNMSPQENKEIPLAADIEGLEKYWRNLAGLPKVNESEVDKPNLQLVLKKEVVKGQYQYLLEWEKMPEGKNYEHTLISYPSGPYIFPYPVKTVKQGEGPYATIGNGLLFNHKTGQKQLVLDDYQGEYIFVLYIKDNDTNKVYSSKPLEVDFEDPLINNKGIYKDIHPKEWAYGPVATLFNNNIMLGTRDKYFNPLEEVTFSELTAIMDKIVRRTYGEESLGFLELCISKNIMDQDDIENLKYKNKVTREDAAYIAYNYMMLEYNYNNNSIKTNNFKDDNKVFRKNEVGFLEEEGIIKGYNNYYYPQNNITRQELASILHEVLTN